MILKGSVDVSICQLSGLCIMLPVAKSMQSWSRILFYSPLFMCCPEEAFVFTFVLYFSAI